jgi:hypothetical protein
MTMVSALILSFRMDRVMGYSSFSVGARWLVAKRTFPNKIITNLDPYQKPQYTPKNILPLIKTSKKFKIELQKIKTLSGKRKFQ